MSQHPGKLSLFVKDLKRRGVTRLAAIYAVVGLGIIEAFDIIGGRFLMPDWSFRLVIILVLAGFPLAMILGWIYDITSKGIVKTEAITPEEQAALKTVSWKPGWLTVILFLILILITTAFFVVPRPNALGFRQQDWVLMADLENNTQDELFNKSLLHALSVTIDQSKRINIYPRTQVDEVLKRMQMDTVDRINLPIALEIAERENIKVVILLTISELGGSYVLSTNLINPFTGETIRSNQETATGKDEILSALDKLAADIRKDLGESLQKIHLQSVPLPKATTNSLEALKCLTNAAMVIGDPYYQKQKEILHEAIQLDPEFALAHSNLAAYYYWTNDRENGEKHISIALSLLDRLTERERLWIQAAVEGYRGNREESIIKWGTFLSQYPNSYAAWFRLGYNYMMLDQNAKAISAFSKALEIYNDDDPASFINIASCYTKLEEFPNAIDYYLRAFHLNPAYELYSNINHEYGFAYVQMGEFEKAREVFMKLLTGDANAEAHSKRSLALLSMYRGKYTEAASLIHEAVILHKSIGSSLSELRNRLYMCKIYEARGMQHELLAELDHCYSTITEAASEPLWYLYLGIMFVRNGEVEKAEELLMEIIERSNTGNRNDEMSYNLLKGEIALKKGGISEALELFETGAAIWPTGYSLESLAHYYIETEDWEKAILTYEKLIEIRGSLGWEAQESWVQAFFNLGKAYEASGDTAKASTYYNQFLEIWKEADEDLPALVEARSRLSQITQSSS